MWRAGYYNILQIFHQTFLEAMLQCPETNVLSSHDHSRRFFSFMLPKQNFIDVFSIAIAVLLVLYGSNIGIIFPYSSVWSCPYFSFHLLCAQTISVVKMYVEAFLHIMTQYWYVMPVVFLYLSQLPPPSQYVHNTTTVWWMFTIFISACPYFALEHLSQLLLP